jgi:hypothetical protein
MSETIGEAFCFFFFFFKVRERECVCALRKWKVVFVGEDVNADF